MLQNLKSHGAHQVKTPLARQLHALHDNDVEHKPQRHEHVVADVVALVPEAFTDKFVHLESQAAFWNESPDIFSRPDVRKELADCLNYTVHSLAPLICPVGTLFARKLEERCANLFDFDYLRHRPLFGRQRHFTFLCCNGREFPGQCQAFLDPPQIGN